MADYIYIIFTRNWVDPDGEGHGFRAVSMSAFADMAEVSAHNQRASKLASKSKWEVAKIPSEVIVQHTTQAEKGN